MFTIFSLSMSSKQKHFNNSDNFPFTKEQLIHFRKELNDAGGFHALMFQKKGLVKRLGMKYISQYHNVEMYKQKYLVGVYETLKPFYDTEMPFVFWSEMYEVLLASEFDL